MAATAPKSFGYEIDVEDVEYLRHGDTPLLARLFKPRGRDRFRRIVELHGGAWCLGDRLNDEHSMRQLARGGILVAALDFRVPPAASYPGSLADINYGIRWLKSQAAELGTRPDRCAPSEFPAAAIRRCCSGCALTTRAIAIPPGRSASMRACAASSWARR